MSNLEGPSYPPLGEGEFKDVSLEINDPNILLQAMETMQQFTKGGDPLVITSNTGHNRDITGAYISPVELNHNFQAEHSGPDEIHGYARDAFWKPPVLEGQDIGVYGPEMKKKRFISVETFTQEGIAASGCVARIWDEVYTQDKTLLFPCINIWAYGVATIGYRGMPYTFKGVNIGHEPGTLLERLSDSELAAITESIRTARRA